MIKIPELVAQERVERSSVRITYHDKSIQHISNPNIDQRDPQVVVRIVPVKVDIVLVALALVIGLIIIII